MTAAGLTTSSPTSTSAPFARGRLAIAIAVAAVVNAVVFLIADAASASMLITTPAESEIGLAMTIGASIVPATLAGVVTWFIGRRRPGFVRVAGWLGLAVAVVSVPSPLVGAADTETGLALASMHVVVGIAWAVGLLTGRR